MKKFFSVLILASGIMVAPLTSSSTQAQSGCYLEGTGGQHIDLGHLCGAGSSTPSVGVSGVYQIPIIRRVSGIPTVMVVFNGKQRFEMLFDTGASGVTITESMAKAIGVRKETQDVAQTAGGPVAYHLGRVFSLQAGNLTRKNLVVGIVSQMEGQDQGLLGQNFFGDYDVMIKEKVIELHPRR
ncbi:retropepsin-like aspartic protease family protein [Gloeothece verrucosa]|uniref:Peptidase A2 domain-containing protein n=1 Tax=Gloeothece verrucosa (strain PCC 7822) TaxID=497965 RepID=E0UB69_GLOV7|nr:retropepsin-like aspartic protease [Gloeothece verrucosa]ADN16314.1 conserved hypothetical protein [Gloeothece verrucosa PCC 7822]